MPDRPEKHPEYSRVELAYGVESPDGWVPAGTTGTVVHIYPGDVAYEVEFTRPVQTVATVKASFLRD